MLSKFIYRINVLILAIFTITLKEIRGQACDPGCQREINGIYELTDGLRTDLKAADLQIQSLLKRVIELENIHYNDVEPFMQRINKWQPQVQANFTALRNLIDTEVISVYDYLQNNLNTAKAELNAKITNLTIDVNYLKSVVGNSPAPVPPPATTPGLVQEVYYNLTQRIYDLETGKVQNLSSDNAMWRRNFRVVNSTFERMKRNGCLC